MRKALYLHLLLLASYISNAQKLVPCSCKSEASGKRQYGFCDPLGIDFKIKCQYDSVTAFVRGTARVFQNGKIGFADSTGKVVIPISFDEAEDFSDGFAYVSQGGKYFYINTKGINQFGKFFPQPEIKLNDNAAKAMASMDKEKAASLLKSMTATMKEAAYLFNRDFKFNNGLAKFYDSAKKAGYIDTKGNVAIPNKFDLATAFSAGIAFVKEGPAGIAKAINSKGVVLFEFNNYMPMPEGFQNGFARVKIMPAKGEFRFSYNYIDQAGKLLLSESAAGAEPFQEGHAVITNKGYKQELIDNKGNKNFNQTFSYIGFVDVKNHFYYSDNTSVGFGIINNKGEKIIEPKYKDFTRINDTTFMCKYLGGYYTLVSVNSGEIIAPVSFTDHRWKKTGNKAILTLYNPRDAITGQLVSIDFDPVTGKFLKDGKEIPVKENAWHVVNRKKQEKPAAANEVAEEGKLSLPPDKETIVATINGLTVVKGSQGYGLRDAKGDLVFPAIMDYIGAGDVNESFEVSLLGYRMERCFLGNGFAGDMNCDVCEGDGMVKKDYRVSGDRSKKVYKSYLGNGIWKEVTVTTTEPPKNVRVNSKCTRCDGRGKMRGGINYFGGNIKIWYWKDELNNSRN